jgi:hypothetical protein
MVEHYCIHSIRTNHETNIVLRSMVLFPLFPADTLQLCMSTRCRAAARGLRSCPSIQQQDRNE